LTTVDVDRALTDERSLAVMWLNRRDATAEAEGAKRLAKAKPDRRQRGGAASEPAPDSELHPSAGVHGCVLARLACALGVGNRD
jgi:hypothetical protein